MKLTPDIVERLRAEHYNARVEHIRRIHDELLILRVRPEGDRPAFVPGQYTVLGLGSWEPHLAGIPTKEEPRDHLIRRAYSISCPMVDERGQLLRCADCDFLEFYIAVVNGQINHPASLTPRLAALQEGDPMFLGAHMHGHYTLDPLEPQHDVVFVATGTGEAPHNGMIVELLSQGHSGRIVAVTCVRYRRDLGYLKAHRELERRFSNYRYLPLTTREPENLDPHYPNYVGKRYLQDYVGSEKFESDSGFQLDPQRTQVYLCGNPMMIGLPQRDKNGDILYPEPTGMIELLVHRGFRIDRPHEPGNIHFEKFW